MSEVEKKAKRLRALAPPALADRLRRAIWTTVWFTLYRPTPIQLHAWRRVLLRLFGAKIGVRAHPYPTARIRCPWNLTMAVGSCIANDVECYNVVAVVLGEGAIVSQRAHLCTASHDVHDPDFPLVGAPIVLEAKSWVAAEAFIGPGVTMNEGAVAAARAVVTRDAPAWTIVAGNPAKAICVRARHSERICQE